MNQPPPQHPGYPQAPGGYPPAGYPPAGQPPMQQPPMQQPPMQQPALATAGGSSGKRVGGVIMLVFGILMLLGSTFFGYFCAANYGAAGRIVAKRPDAVWVGRIIERKARNQGIVAGVLGVLGLGLGIGGLLLRAAGKPKPGAPSPAAYPPQQPAPGMAAQAAPAGYGPPQPGPAAAPMGHPGPPPGTPGAPPAPGGWPTG